MDMLHQLFENIKTLIDEAKNENRGRPKKRKLVIHSPTKQQYKQP